MLQASVMLYRPQKAKTQKNNNKTFISFLFHFVNLPNVISPNKKEKL